MAQLPIWLAMVLGFATPARAIEWTTVGDPGNGPDIASNCFAADCGMVSYVYDISKYEVTNSEYSEFLNAKASADPLELYNSSMDTHFAGGITRSGVPGSYTYAVKPGFEKRPVNFVSFYDALRFSNWLNNGKGASDTETGAYTLLGGTPIPTNGATVVRNADGKIFLPSENEWYKAAYFDSLAGGYYEHAAGTDTAMDCVAPTANPNSANCSYAVGSPTDVGAYPGSSSPYGTFDQGGNVYEWNEIASVNGSRGRRGGSYDDAVNQLAASWSDALLPVGEFPNQGFRVARTTDVSSLIEWVTIGAPGNREDDTGFGSVPYAFRISKYEITNAQYALFLNATAHNDPRGLWDVGMLDLPGGITRYGGSGEYYYETKPGYEHRPVNYISFFDAIRFANWMHNGESRGDAGEASTEFGAYSVGLGTVGDRNQDAAFFVPSEDEWYKAAYFEVSTDNYFDYPTSSNTAPVCILPDPSAMNAANCADPFPPLENGVPTAVGSYPLSPSPFGTYDQGGNVTEWTESPAVMPGDRIIRGGDANFSRDFLASANRRMSYPGFGYYWYGFRIAAPLPVPEPAGALPYLVAVLSTYAMRRRVRKSAPP